jgi:Cof subfamily protein (haloacid dehalogenase superfamily)
VAPPIRLLLADVDGTLVTQDKVLTDRAIAAVAKLRQAGIVFAITSGRPPRGMSMLIEPLQLTTPIAGFNGGVYIRPDMSVIEQQTIPDDVTPTVIELLGTRQLDVWVYQGADWFIRDPKAPHVARETRTVKFDPTVTDSLASVTHGAAKIVGVSDDYDAVQKGVDAVREHLGDHVSAVRSQPYYCDVTNPNANKGAVAQYLSRTCQIPPEQIATIGDQPNDVLMFAHSGLSIAMGNASQEVQKAARRVTTSNEDEGFANAVERFVLSLEVAVLAAVEGDGAGDAEHVALRPDQPLLGSRARVIPEQRDAAGAVGRRLDQQAGAACGQHPVVAVGVRHRDQLDRAARGLPVDVQYAARPGGLEVEPAGQMPGVQVTQVAAAVGVARRGQRLRVRPADRDQPEPRDAAARRRAGRQDRAAVPPADRAAGVRARPGDGELPDQRAAVADQLDAAAGTGGELGAGRGVQRLAAIEAAE